MGKKHNVHDSGYKKLFSSPVIVKELLLYFVDEPWVQGLDYNTLERLDKSFVTPLSALTAPFPMNGRNGNIPSLLSSHWGRWPWARGGGTKCSLNREFIKVNLKQRKIF